jgi:hypothetical protein
VTSEAVDVARPAAAASRARRASWIAWAAWLAGLAPTIGGLVLLALTWDASIPDSYGFRGFNALLAVTFATVGAIILARQPGNRVGWIFAATGIVSGVVTLVIEYANYGLLIHPGSLPGAVVAAWLGAWIFVPQVVLAVPIFLLFFPDGALVASRWRWAVGVALAAMVLFSLSVAFRPGPLENFRSVDNPIGVLPVAIADLLTPLSRVTAVACVALAAASLVVRFGRAGRPERQQLKWVAAAALVISIVTPVSFTGGKVGEGLFILAWLGLPVAAGIAVTRYHLYEIDVIINRTIVYGALTAILAGI